MYSVLKTCIKDLYLCRLVTTLLIIYGHHEGQKRQRRYLLFTSYSQWGVFATVSIPLDSDSTVSVAWVFQAGYYEVANSSYFNMQPQDVTISRRHKKRSLQHYNDLTRTLLYIFIESMFEKHGFAGRPCLLRAICENATSHFLHNGVLGDLLHLIFTPSTSISEDSLEDIYYEAEYHGLENNCEQYTYRCPLNPLEYISLSIDDLK